MSRKVSLVWSIEPILIKGVKSNPICKLKWEVVFISKMGQNWKYPLRLSHVYKMKLYIRVDSFLKASEQSGGLENFSEQSSNAIM